MITKEMLFSRKTKIEKVFIKSLDDHIYVREFVVSERNKLRDIDNIDYQFLSLILGICDKDGKAIFTYEDIPQMEKMSQLVADELFLAVVKTNDPDDKDAIKK